MSPVKSEISAVELARALEEYLSDHPRAAVLEDGRVLFEMQKARYALSAQHGRCVLQLWSEECNMVRTVTGISARKDTLRIETRRFGQSRPQSLELVPDRDQRTPTAREATRKRYLRTLERVLTRVFTDYTIVDLHNAMDLEHSFGPAYARATLVRGPRAWAVIAVNAEEMQATIDGVLTLGILWLAYCREHSGGRRLFEGLKVIVPAGAAEVTRARMALLNPSLAKWELNELEERAEELTPVILEEGNLETRLVYAFDPVRAKERMQSVIDRVLDLLPTGIQSQTEVCPLSANEISFRLHGLEFAHAQHGLAPGSFARRDSVTFGAGPNETPLTDETEDFFKELMTRVYEGRFAGGSVRNPLYRLQPERWLESELREGLAEIEPSIREEFVYSQVPAFSGGDRGMIDLLSVTRAGRLVVLEIKADEDLHLPLQGLDYWVRVRQVHADGGLQKHGYFPGMEMSANPPLLMLVAPALRIHPANETVLRYLKPEVEWMLVALDEQWRKRLRVIFRKRSESNKKYRPDRSM
ncbi:MAG TPA: hypothetical protein VHT24_00780 [Pseudacidobacterium sp.]|jgi:hypothetical protein|nr:hypothetical protein [Pseudacidobacterium sp.]